MFSNRKGLKPLYLWLLFLLSLIIGIALIIWVSNTSNTTIPLILMVVDFVFLSMVLQPAIAKTFKFKPRPKQYVSNQYSLEDFGLLKETLKNAKYKERTLPYGFVYNKIVDKILFKIVLIADESKYFNQNDTSQESGMKIDDCVGLIGFEIFATDKDEVKTKVLDFSFQGNNVYYEGLYYEAITKTLIEPNYVAPSEKFLASYNIIMNDLNLIRREVA